MNGRIGVDAATWANRRGYGRFIHGLLPLLAETLGPDRLVLFLDPLSAQADDLPPGTGRVIVPVHEAPTQAASSEGRRSIADLLRMSRAVARTPVDLMFFPSCYSYFPMLRPVTTVVTIHDVIAERHSDLVFPKRSLALQWRMKMLLVRLQADFVLTVSEASRAAIQQVHRIASDKVRVVPEGADDVFHPRCASPSRARALAAYGLGATERFLLYVGGISPHKNLDTLLRAHAAIVEQPRFADVRLALVGDYSGDSFHTCYDELVHLRAELGTDGSASFLGFVPDDEMAELYAAAEAVVLPSFDEGFGLPALEGMASGAAVVASDRGSLPEVLGGAGRLFDPTSVAALTAALADVLGDERRRTEMVERGLERASVYTWWRSAEAVAQAFDDLLA